MVMGVTALGKLLRTECARLLGCYECFLQRMGERRVGLLLT